MEESKMAPRIADQENGVDNNDIHWDRELPGGVKNQDPFGTC